MANQYEPQTTRVIVEERRGGGGMTAIIAIVLLIAVLVGGYFAFVSTDSTVKKNDAIAGAAQSVGAAADKAGEVIDPKK
ncbi:MAG: hypothetical protein ABI898_12780 [Sphingomonadales bacterium]